MQHWLWKILLIWYIYCTRTLNCHTSEDKECITAWVSIQMGRLHCELDSVKDLHLILLKICSTCKHMKTANRLLRHFIRLETRRYHDIWMILLDLSRFLAQNTRPIVISAIASRAPTTEPAIMAVLLSDKNKIKQKKEAKCEKQFSRGRHETE